ncbi:MAG TPA: hypothetical protein VFE25_09185 [Opitutaceae bacterium]|jgi:hypothetical protein|nr:hypothetical protein [Opitutaceae bacterium]
MSLTALLIIHLSAVFVLLGYTFYAFGAPIETKRRVMMITGTALLVVLLTGGAMLGKAHMGFPGWAIVKLVCLLGLGTMASFAYRRRAQADAFMLLTLALAIIAVVMVLVRPF